MVVIFALVGVIEVVTIAQTLEVPRPARVSVGTLLTLFRDDVLSPEQMFLVDVADGGNFNVFEVEQDLQQAGAPRADTDYTNPDGAVALGFGDFTGCLVRRGGKSGGATSFHEVAA